jgi:hypothetical protein
MSPTPPATTTTTLIRTMATTTTPPMQGLIEVSPFLLFFQLTNYFVIVFRFYHVTINDSTPSLPTLSILDGMWPKQRNCCLGLRYVFFLSFYLSFNN